MTAHQCFRAEGLTGLPNTVKQKHRKTDAHRRHSRKYQHRRGNGII